MIHPFAPGTIVRHRLNEQELFVIEKCDCGLILCRYETGDGTLISEEFHRCELSQDD